MQTVPTAPSPGPHSNGLFSLLASPYRGREDGGIEERCFREMEGLCSFRLQYEATSITDVGDGNGRVDPQIDHLYVTLSGKIL